MHADDDDDGHPLLAELASLRQTAARFQHEAHTAAIKLQRYSLESSRLHEHLAALEQENVRLAHELATLRANPVLPEHPAVAQVQELSIALRRVSEKVTFTEETLLQRTVELSDARSELVKAKHVTDGAYTLVARMRAHQDASKARERELEFKARASEEERKMVDLVVQEYADLVRNLEGRRSVNGNTPIIQNGSTSSITLVDTLQDGKSNLHRMLTAFSTESEHLHATITDLNTKVSDLEMTLDAERNSASHDRALLAQAKTELDKHRLDDQTAAKTVARYMKFSQSSTNTLQQQITTLKTRHASTISTFELQMSITESQLATERARAARLQDALDELCEDLARESYGRRREVSLRLALLSREEAVAEFMQRWARRARESYMRCCNPTLQSPEDAIKDAFHRVVSDAESLLSTLDDDVQISDSICTSGSLARITLSRDAVEALRQELQDELQKRLEAVQRSTFSLSDVPVVDTLSDVENGSQPSATPPQESNDTPNYHLFTPNGDAREEMQASAESLQSQDTTSPMSVVGAPDESTKDPFTVPPAIVFPVPDLPDQFTAQGNAPPLPSTSPQDSDVTLATLFVDGAPEALQPHSPAVSILDLHTDVQLPVEEEPLSVNGVAVQASLNKVEPVPEVNGVMQVLVEDDIPSPLTSISTPMPVSAAFGSPASKSSPSALLSELEVTKHRYDNLQHAFRDCSLALKELKRTLASSTPSSPAQTNYRQDFETALARIDDYTEDARVELEIRVADEELTARGFETVLSVPGALVDANERAEIEASIKCFVDGTDEGVARALDKFGRKLEDVQHDVAVVKRAVHDLAMGDGENGEVDVGSNGSGWTAWTAGLLGNTAPSRSPTPAQTFGVVMTSPRLRRAASLENTALAGLELRIPMPSPSRVPVGYSHLGLGRATESPRPKMLSAMYGMGGLRSSSIGLGVGLGSPSPARTRVQENSKRIEEADFGDVE